MIHRGERLPLGFEPRNHLPRVHAEIDKFERAMRNGLAPLFGHINRPRPASPMLKKFVANKVIAAPSPGGPNSLASPFDLLETDAPEQVMD